MIKPMIKSMLLAGAMLLCFANPSFAAHPLITDDTGTQGKGKFQMEINGEQARNDEDGVKTRETELGAILSCGAAETVDLVIGVPYQWLRAEQNGESIFREDGLSDITVEIKWRMLSFEKLSLALKPGLSLPTGDENKGLGSGKAAESLFLISTYEAEPVAIHANLGYIHNRNDTGDRENLWHVSIAAEYTVGENVTLVGNTGIEHNPDPNSGTNPAFILGGLIYSLSEDLDIDLGFKAGLNSAEADYTVLAGMAWRF